MAKSTAFTAARAAQLYERQKQRHLYHYTTHTHTNNREKLIELKPASADNYCDFLFKHKHTHTTIIFSIASTTTMVFTIIWMHNNFTLLDAAMWMTLCFYSNGSTGYTSTTNYLSFKWEFILHHHHHYHRRSFGDVDHSCYCVIRIIFKDFLRYPPTSDHQCHPLVCFIIQAVWDQRRRLD